MTRRVFNNWRLQPAIHYYPMLDLGPWARRQRRIESYPSDKMLPQSIKVNVQIVGE